MDLTHTHAPFRQSKLTHILRDSLVGSKTRTCLMATVSPADDCCQCSLNTLQYASRIRDISIRHRHRTIPMTNIQMNYNDDIKIEQDKPQRTFKPATASTPVHRLMPSVDQRIYGIDTRLTKPTDIDWQIADDDDDMPITGGGDNLPLKSLTLSTREFLINSNNNHIQSTLNRFQQKPTTDIDQSPSSYFPQPQADIKKSPSIKRSFDNPRLMYDDGNERQWKAVPAPTISRLSNSSVEQTTTTRYIPVAPIHIPDDNPYNSATGTESLGTKITKVASTGQRLQYDIDTEQMLYSDRQDTNRDQTGFFTNRDELLSIVSSRLTNVTQRSSSVTTPKTTKNNSSKTSVSSPNKTRSKTRLIKSSSSAASLASAKQDKKSLIDNKKSKVSSSLNFQKFDPSIRRSTNRHHHHHHQRTAPLRVHHSSDSEEHEKSRHNIQRRKTYSTRSEAAQIIKTNNHIMKNEKEQTDEYFIPEQKTINKNTEQALSLLVPTSSPLPLTSSSPTFIGQTSSLYNRSLQQPISPLASSYSKSTGSPSKEFGVRVSDQLNALRSLLETRLLEQDDNKRQTKETSSILQTSPGTFARDFLQSFRQSSSYKNNSTEFHSDIDDADKEVARNFHTNKTLQQYEGDNLSTSTISSNHHGYSSVHHNHHHYEQIIQPNLSSLSDELNHAKVSSSATASSTSTITSNLAAKIDTRKLEIIF
jgi:hypothetical protein